MRDVGTFCKMFRVRVPVEEHFDYYARTLARSREFEDLPAQITSYESMEARVPDARAHRREPVRIRDGRLRPVWPARQDAAAHVAGSRGEVPPHVAAQGQGRRVVRHRAQKGGHVHLSMGDIKEGRTYDGRAGTVPRTVVAILGKEAAEHGRVVEYTQPGKAVRRMFLSNFAAGCKRERPLDILDQFAANTCAQVQAFVKDVGCGRFAEVPYGKLLHEYTEDQIWTLFILWRRGQ